MILLRPRNSFDTQRRKRFGVVKVTALERQTNLAAREALVDGLAPILEDLIDDFRLNVDDELRGRLAAGGLRIGVPNEALAAHQAAMRDQLTQAFTDAIERGGQIGMRFGGSAVSGVPVDLVTTTARNWIDSQGADRINDILGREVTAVRRAVNDVLADQISFGEASDRISQVVGLSARDARALRNFEQSRIRSLIRTPEANTQFVRETIAQEVEAKRRALVRNRARAIAETEMQNAIQEGELRFWDAAVASGEVEESKVGKRWFTVQDDRVCPICRPLHETIVPLKSSFSSLGFTGLRPPAHVFCRCYMQFATDGDFDQVAQETAETIIPEPAPQVENPGGLPPARDSINPDEDFDPGTKAKTDEMRPLFDKDFDEDLAVAIDVYTEDGYIDMNRRMRGQEISGESFMSVEDIDDSINDMQVAFRDPGVTETLAEDIVMYRGLDIDPEDFGNFEIGHVYTDKAFGSFTTDRSTAARFASVSGQEPEIIRVRMPKATKGIWIGSDESEWIQRHGSRYRIVAVEEDVPFASLPGFKPGTTESRFKLARRRVITVEVVERERRRLKPVPFKPRRRRRGR